MPPFGFLLELHEGTTSCQFCIICTGFLSTDVLTSSWHVSFIHLCPARHLRTWLTKYTWFRKVQDIGSTRPPTDHVLFHAHTIHLATEDLLPLGHVFGTASQYTKTLVITVFGVNSKRFGFNVASRVQCDIPINCTIQKLNCSVLYCVPCCSYACLSTSLADLQAAELAGMPSRVTRVV